MGNVTMKAHRHKQSGDKQSGSKQSGHKQSGSKRRHFKHRRHTKRYHRGGSSPPRSEKHREKNEIAFRRMSHTLKVRRKINAKSKSSPSPAQE
jgi:hypothetical protein